jgi:hypothetical protein
MEDCGQLLAVVRSDAAAHEWADACARLKTVFEKLPGDAKAALVSGNDCVPALLHAIGRQGSGGDDSAGAALVGACDALNAVITGLPKEAKQALLSGERGVVDALLRVLADARGKRAWGSVGFCFRNLFLDVAAEVRQQLLSDGRGVVEAIVGVLESDEAPAWEGACGALRAFPIDVSVGLKESLLSGEKGIVRALLRVLGDSKGKAAWSNACFSLGNILNKINEDFKQSLLSDGRGVVEAIIGVLEGDEAAAWVGAGGALTNFLRDDFTVTTKQSLLSGEKGIVRALLRVLGDSKGKAAWANACRCFWNMFIGTSVDCKEALLSDGRGVVEAIVGVLESDEAAAWVGSVGALNIFLRDISVTAKQSLLSGEKGIVRALLRVLGDSRGKSDWYDACRCFGYMFLGTSADCKEALLSDGFGVVEAIVGVLESDEAAAWEVAGTVLVLFLSDISVTAKQSLLNGEKGIIVRILRVLGESNHGGSGGACFCMSALLADLPPSAKSTFLLSQPQLVATIIACLDSEEAHSSWAGATRLLKRLVHQEALLSHINLCTLDFLNRDRGLYAVLVRCSLGFGSDANSKSFYSTCEALEQLSGASHSEPFFAMSHEILALFLAASRLCSHDPALLKFAGAMSNFSENVAYCSVLGQVKLHEYALSKITGVTAADERWNNATSEATLCLSVIVNMSRNEALHAELKQSGVIEILTPLADAKCAAQLRVLMAMSYLIGCKESSANSGGALAQLANSTSIGKIVDCLENTLNLKGGPGYDFGLVVLPAILQV